MHRNHTVHRGRMKPLLILKMIVLTVGGCPIDALSCSFSSTFSMWIDLWYYTWFTHLIHPFNATLFDYGAQFVRARMAPVSSEVWWTVPSGGTYFPPLWRLFVILLPVFPSISFLSSHFFSHLLIRSMMTITCTTASVRPFQMLLATHSLAKVSTKRRLTPLPVSSSLLRHAA